MRINDLTSRIPKIKVTRKSASNNTDIIKGYYFEMPETTYCYENDPIPNTKRYVVVHCMTDWGLPNKCYLYELSENDEIEIINEGEEQNENN